MAQLQSTGITGSLTVTGNITAQEFHTEYVSSSILHESGSTSFGNTSDDVHNFTGSLNVQGSINTTSGYGHGLFERVHINNLQSWSAQDLGSASSGSIAFRVNGRSGATNDFIIHSNGTENYTMQVVGNAETSGQLHINPFGGNVGIGTTSPTAKLQVQGSSFFTNDIFTLQNKGIFFNGVSDFSSGIAGTDSGTSVRIFAGGSEKVRVKSTGNVGIGTTSPANKLDVKISTSNRTTLEPVMSVSAEGSGPYSGFGPKISFSSNIYYGAATGNPAGIIETAYVGAVMGTSPHAYATNSDLVFGTRDGATSVTEKMRILGNGNVGIGTTSPGRKLTVTGDVSGDANNLLLSNENDTDGDSASIGFSMLSNNTYVKSGIFFKRTTTQGRGDLIFATNNEVNGNNVTLSNARMTIQAGGNVGIGNTSPLAPLHIVTPAVAGIDLTNISRTANNLVRFTNPQYSTSATMGLLLRVFPDSDARQGAGLLMTGGSDNSSSNLSLFVSKDDGSGNNISKSYSALHIAGNTGNVGIGTTSPSQLLHINNSSGDFSAESVLRGSLSTGTPKGEVAFKRHTSGDGAGIVLRTSNSSGTIQDVLTLDTSKNATFAGNVYLKKASNQGQLFFGTADNQYEIFGGGMWGYLGYNTGGYHRFFSSGTEVMRITAGGDVGIGTTNPETKLHVESGGAGDADGTCVYLHGDTATNHPVMRIDNATGGNGTDTHGLLINNTAAGAGLRINNASTTALIVKANGNVGIGTDSPTSKLEVAGRISGGELGNSKINRNGLSLYVDFNDKACVSGTSATEEPTDLGPNQYNLTLHGGANFEYRGGIGTYYFDGTNDHINVNDFVVADTSNTYEFWHWANAQSGWETIWDSGNERPLLGTYNNNLRAYPNATNFATIDTGKWYHLVFAFASDSNLDIYVNGNKVADSVNWGNNQRLGTFQAWLGGDGGAETTNGFISIARTYTRQLNADDVLQNFNAEVDIFATQTPSLGIVQKGGNVGIGTSTPAVKFQIHRSDDTATQAGITNSGAGAVALYFDASNGDMAGGDYMQMGQNNDLSGQIQMEPNAGAFNIKTGTSSPTRFTVLQNGHIGIGETSPTFLLHVKGTPPANNGALINARNSAATTTNTTFGGIFFNSAPGYDFSIGKSNVNTATTLSFRNGNDGASLMDITPSGNVGIGTPSPDQTGYGYKVLTIMGGTTAGYAGVLELLTPSTDANGQNLGIVSFGSGGTRNAMIGAVRQSGNNNGKLEFWTAAGANGVEKRMVIDADGQVGIGTDSPGSKLEVKTSGTNSVVELDNSDSQYSLIQYNAEGATKGFSGYNSGFMLFGGEAGVTTRLQSGGSYAATILTNGNVGIGTTSPDAKLTVVNPTSDGESIFKIGPSGTNTHAGHKEFESITGTATNDGWYSIGNINDSCSAMVVIKTAAHSGATLIVNRGYGQSNHSHIQALSTTLNPNGGYANIKAVRIHAGGLVDIQLGWNSGPTVEVEVNVYGNGWNFAGDLRLSVGGTGTYPYNVLDTYTFEGGSGHMRVHEKLLTGGDIKAGGDVIAYATSDREFKDNLEKIDSPLHKISKLNGYYFNWNDKQTTYSTGTKDIGIVAQEVEEVIPEIVTTRENGHKAVRYEKMVALLVEGMKEQQETIDKLEDRIKKLENR